MADTIRRLKAVIAIGADVAFVEGLRSKEEVIEAVKALAPTPVLLNLVLNGVTPNFSADEARELGARIAVRCPCPFDVSGMHSAARIDLSRDFLEASRQRHCQGAQKIKD